MTPKERVIAYCKNHNLDIPAVRTRRGEEMWYSIETSWQNVNGEWSDAHGFPPGRGIGYTPAQAWAALADDLGL